MKLSCEIRGLGHRFQNKFLFRNLSFTVTEGEITFITGHNGSGKSTLLKIISGAMQSIEGSVHFLRESGEILEDELWKEIGFVSPYQELPEDLSLEELVRFQMELNKQADGTGFYRELMETFGLSNDRNKLLRFYSTGMKQKARFILNLGSGRPVWLLDEPTSNLDPESFAKFWDFVRTQKKNRIVLVASNDPAEFQFADKSTHLSGS
jgi:ABC-type multidrug transport system ATPase subunit